MATYLLAGTLKPDTAKAAAYYLGKESADQAVQSWLNAQIERGQVIQGHTVAELRPDLSPAFAARLGIDRAKPLSPDAVANLLNITKADGSAIQGRQRHKATDSRAPVGFIDLTLSADKSLTVAWALAPTAHERDQLLNIHRQSVADTMAYASTQLGFTRRGKEGRPEQGAVAWMSFQHYTARPTVDIVRQDSQGRSYTEIRELPMRTADPQLHTHVIMLNSVLTERGDVRAMDTRQLRGRVKEFGAVYHAHVATRLREHGIEAVLDRETGAARLTAIPRSVRDLFSKRRRETIEAAREFARKKGVDWDATDGERKIQLFNAGAAATRQAKEGDKTDFAVWLEQAQVAGYTHRPVMTSRQIAEPEDRIQAAYRTGLPMLDSAFRRRAVIGEQEIREMAARSLIATGIRRPGEDIDAVVKAFRQQGIMQDSQLVKLVYGPPVVVHGREQRQVTTGLHVAHERELVELAKAAAADRSAALPLERIEQSARVYLSRHPKIDGDGAQWRAQHSMMVQLAAGGRLSVAIGAAGAGKSTILAPLVDAWKSEGREIYGITLAWRQAAELRKADISHPSSVAAFIHRVETGKYTLDRNSVIVVDEVSLIGTKQMLDLLRIRDETGAQIVMVGDPKQCQAIEGAGAIELLREALGAETIPEILTSIRQKTERELEIAGLWREGKAAEALEMKRQDGTAILVAGGREETVQRVAQLWFERAEANRADPEYKIIITAPTNADTREIGAAIREDLRARGELGPDLAVLNAGDGRGERYQLPIAIGDQVRLFDRVYAGRRAIASNGEVAEVRAVTSQGLVLRGKDGTEGLVAWKKIQRSGGPVRLTYGYAFTIDTAQGITKAENIHAMLGGSQAVNGFKAYTAGSRHEHQYWLIVDDASERREITNRAMLGMKPQISEPEVWQNVSENLRRQPLKPGALEMLREEHQPRARLGP